jgi:UDP-N-acetylmuramoyl-L-alanyl-D-glutamate--2,6-diaminopimelate ligase
MITPNSIAKTYSSDLLHLIKGLPVRGINGPLDVNVGSVVEDSRIATPNSAFFVLPGGTTHGRQYVGDALQAGARVLFTNRPLPVEIPVTQVRLGNLDTMRHVIPARFYDQPDEQLTFVGVIGSHQRTRVAALAHYLLDSWSEPTGLIHSAYYDYGSFIEPATLATPEPCELYRILRGMVDTGRHNVVMEITTQALLRQRVQALGMHVLAFTDHYFDPKHGADWPEVLPLKLDAFLQGWNKGCPDVAVINRNENQSAQLLARLPIGVDTVTYGINVPADLRAENLRRTALGWQFTLTWEFGRVQTRLAVAGGRECVLEALGALAIAYAFDRDLREMAWRISDWRDEDSTGLAQGYLI